MPDSGGLQLRVGLLGRSVPPFTNVTGQPPNVTVSYESYEGALARELCTALEAKCSAIPVLDVEKLPSLLANDAVDFMLALQPVAAVDSSMAEFVEPYYYTGAGGFWCWMELFLLPRMSRWSATLAPSRCSVRPHARRTLQNSRPHMVARVQIRVCRCWERDSWRQN